MCAWIEILGKYVMNVIPASDLFYISPKTLAVRITKDKGPLSETTVIKARAKKERMF